MNVKKLIIIIIIIIIIRGGIRDYIYYGWRETAKIYC
jgi:hypothetical protein